MIGGESDKRWARGPRPLELQIAAILKVHPEPVLFKSLAAPEGLPPAFKLKTRRGSVGLLEILAFTENQRGVKFRYKLERMPGAAERRSPAPK